MPEGHDTIIEVCNIMSFVLYTQILKQSVLKHASPGITLNNLLAISDVYRACGSFCHATFRMPGIVCDILSLWIYVTGNTHDVGWWTGMSRE